MGIWDRDWYVQKLRQHDDYRERADTRRSKGKDTRDAIYNPKEFRSTMRNTNPPQLRDLPGVNWHWTIKLIAFAFILLALLIVIRQVKG